MTGGLVLVIYAMTSVPERGWASGHTLMPAALGLRHGPLSTGLLFAPMTLASVGEAGFMLSSVSLTLAGTSGSEDQRSGLAAGLLNTSMQLGSGWGLGIVAVVVGAGLSGGSASAAEYAAALRSGMVACLSFCLLALTLVVWRLRR